MPGKDDAPTDPIAQTVAENAATAPTRTASPTTGRNAGELPARYKLAGSLGAGGMGEVLLARDTQIDRDVAIKRMLIEPSGPAVARFLREARVQGRLDHPAIVPVYELAHDAEGRPFFVMKRLAGTTLADVLAKHAGDPRFTRQKLLRAFADACLAIELAHSRDVIHRDLKPANIMLGDFGEVYVLDWGIARVAGETDPVGAAAAATTTAEHQLTQAGAILGTPGYIAPELVRGETIDASADVFGLGCILFEILAGQPLLLGTGLAGVLGDYDARPSARSPERDIPPELDVACVAATALDRTTRPTARALAEMIERFLDGDRDLAQRKRLAATHLEAAHAALAAGDGEVERAIAMREAGRALGLDPTSGAAELLGRLMLEPPKQIPREVEARMTEIDDLEGRTKARTFMPTYAFGLVTTPLLVFVGVDTVGLVLFALAMAVNVATSVAVIRKRTPTTAMDLYAAALANSLLIAMASVVFGPVLLAPPIAIITIVMFASDQRMRAGALAALTIGPVIVPWLLSVIGGIGIAVSQVDGDLVQHTPFLSLRMPGGPIAYAMYVIFTIAMGGFATRKLAIDERTARRAVELQAWHLRKLVGGG